jgi:transcriptional regulator with XRE-family HTH domain
VPTDSPLPRVAPLLGERVRERRNEKGWSQEKLAKEMTALGFSWNQTTAAKTERAARPVNADEMFALATLFGVAVDELMRPPPPPLELRAEQLIAVRNSANRQLFKLEESRVSQQAYIDHLNQQLDMLDCLKRAQSNEAELRKRAPQVLDLFGADEGKTILSEAGLTDGLD